MAETQIRRMCSFAILLSTFCASEVDMWFRTWDCSSGLPSFGLQNDENKSSRINVRRYPLPQGRPLNYLLQWGRYTSSQDPWTSTISPGFIGLSCQFPQITSEGWEDSRAYGSVITVVSRIVFRIISLKRDIQDLRDVYAPLLALPSTYDATSPAFAS